MRGANATVEGVKFAFAGGTGNNKTVLSIGKAGTERVIKHVAAGEVNKTQQMLLTEVNCSV